ncbi:hypothetical protein ACHAWF_000943 [Thalassiosira exigua]
MPRSTSNLSPPPISLPRRKARDELAESEDRQVTEALEREAYAIRKVESLALQLRAKRAGWASAERFLCAEDGAGERGSGGAGEGGAAWEAHRSILVGGAERWCGEELAEVRRERDTAEVVVRGGGEDASGGGAGAGGGGGGRGGGGGYVSPIPPPPSGSGPKLAAYEAEIGELTSSACWSKSARPSPTMCPPSISRWPTPPARTSWTRAATSSSRLEYNALDLDHDPDHSYPERNPPAVSDQEDNLEAVLVAKLRKVEAEMVRERREKSEGNRAHDDLARRLASVQELLRSSGHLVGRDHRPGPVQSAPRPMQRRRGRAGWVQARVTGAGLGVGVAQDRQRQAV